LDCKEIQPVHSEGDQPWDFFGRNDAKAETPVLWPPHAKSWPLEKLWCWTGVGAEGEGDDRGWDGWMASLTRWTWVWVNSGSLWWTGRPGVLRFMGVAKSWTRLSDWTELNWIFSVSGYQSPFISDSEKKQGRNWGKYSTFVIEFLSYMNYMNCLYDRLSLWEERKSLD